MKKQHVIVAILVSLSLLLSAANVFAGADTPAADLKSTKVPGGKPTDAGPKPQKTPGAKATEKAIERATEGKGRKRFTFHGLVGSVGAGSLTLTNAKDGLSYTFSVTAETKINVSSAGNRGTLADVTAGGQALVQAMQGDGDTWTAVHIVVQNAAGTEPETEAEHTVGTVTAYTAGVSITVQGADGTSTTYTLTPKTKILPANRAGLLAVGAQVTIVTDDSAGGGTPVAKGIVVHPSKATATPTPAT